MNYLIRSLIVFTALLGLVACDKGSASKDPNVDYYTCTMHPSVKSQDAKAKCPICSMDLVPVMKKGAPGSHDHAAEKARGPMLSEFSVPVERQQQIGVTYAAAQTKPLHHTIRSVGMVVPDKTRHWEFVARVEGYVQKLYVTSPGEPVEEGQPLLTIYSPELSTAEREFVNLLEARDRAASDGKSSTDRLIEAARRRLEQWNITAAQIAELEKTRKPSEFLTLNSPFKGVVEDVPVDQGRKVMIGDHLVDVADLSVVWVWAQFYEDELSMLAKGQKVHLTAKSYPGQTFEGELSIINPFLVEMSRTGKVRIDIPNAEFKLRPGMYVNIELAMDMGEGLAIPVSAVMPTGSRTLVFIDKGEGKLEPRAVQLGAKYGDDYAVLSGLKEGERVVASANFLIDAESKVQGAVKSFEEPAPSDEKAAEAKPLDKAANALMTPVIESYVAVQKALAQDKLAEATSAAAQLRSKVEAAAKPDAASPADPEKFRARLSALADAIAAFKATTLDEARVQFGKISAALIALESDYPPPAENPVFVLNCPMWDKSPSQWIQLTDGTLNPFMGAKMSTCGEVVKKLEAAK